MNPDPRPTPFRGLLNVRKPIGVTSRDVVNQVTRRHRKLKVGHAGTLDPLASGVLVLCVGSATRLIEYVQRMPKTYRTSIRLGATSDTLDADGQIVETPGALEPSKARVREVLATQVGRIQQLPPQFSALKVDGRRAYDLARAGEVAELAPRSVDVHRVDLLRYAWPNLELEVDCGSGTYIRSIARDVGEALGCGGLIEVLTRTRIGIFSIEDAVDPASVETSEGLRLALRPPVDALGNMPRLALDETELAAIRQGKTLVRSDAPSGEVALLTGEGELAALAECDPQSGRVSPRRVFADL